MRRVGIEMGIRRGFTRSRAALALVATALVVGLLPAVASSAPKVSNPLVVQAAASPNPVPSGTELTYTITVANNGGAAIDQVVTTDQINGLGGIDVGGTNQLVLTSNVGSCTQSANSAGYLVRCEHGTMAGFQVATVTVRGRVTAAAGSVLNNTATTTATKSAQTVSASATTSVQVTGGSGPLADLSASIAAPSTVLTGADYGATITVDNTGAANASDVVVTATAAAGTELLTWSATSLFTCSTSDPGDGTTLLTCTGGAVNAGANAALSLYLRAPAATGTAVLRAQVDPTNAVAESNDLNNSAQASTSYTSSLPSNALVVAKDAPNEVVQYELATYTLTVTNTSGSRADYVTLTDGTQGLDAASVAVNVTAAPSSPGVTCSVAAPQVRCDTTRLAGGGSFTVTVTGQVIAPAGSFIINTATVNGNIRNKGVTSTATGVTVVRPGVDLTVTQHRTFPVVPAPVRAADRFDYTITVGNSGLRDASNVVVREPLPAGVLLDGFDASVAGTTCTPAVPPATGGVVQCVIPLVEGAINGGAPGGTTETIVLELIAPQVAGAITSTVTVDPFNQIAEADETNNTFTTNTDVATGVDLTIAKVDDFDPVARNGTLRYTITVPNLGTQDASAIVVRDPLPAGTQFRSASGDHNFTCSFSSGVVACTGGIVRGTYSGSLTQPVDIATITIDVFAPDEPGTIHNEVRVDPDNAIAEIDESNNVAFEDTVVENGSPNGAYKELSIPQIAVNFDPVATSGTLDYTLTVLNTGSADAFNVTVQAALPAGAIYRIAEDLSPGLGSFTCSAAGTLVTCTGGTVTSASGTRQIRISTFAPPTPGTATLTATVDPANAIGEADEANNVTDKSVQVVAGSPSGIYNNLRVVDITDNFDPVAPSGTLIYTVAVENNGAADAFGVSFRDVAGRVDLPLGSGQRRRRRILLLQRGRRGRRLLGGADQRGSCAAGRHHRVRSRPAGSGPSRRARRPRERHPRR